ncbi:ABC transporter substrate-binding protein [Cohnella cellulosilytica]|uniref:ABC transporter substrate-binding protein n=1 Tax=Cohnella cellulosilytica TaxID=986710 RepID=A0ABW2FJ81_9BACL
MRKTIGAINGLLLAAALAACSSGNGAVPPTGSPVVEQPGTGSASEGSGGGAPSDPPGKTEDDSPKKIVFSTFWPDNKFKEAKQKYEALHPNVEIVLSDVETNNENTDAELEKYATKTNAALLAGSGPDLMEMDKLPIEQYVKLGLLADLNELIDRDNEFRREDYFSNILDNATIGGGLYGMPLGFFLLGFAGDADAIGKAGVEIDDRTWSWEDFAEIGARLKQDGAYANVIAATPASLLTMMVSDHYESFVDVQNRQADFQSPAFTDMMRQVKQMADDGIIGAGRPYFYAAQINSAGDYVTTLREFLSPNMQLYAKPHAKITPAGGYFRSYRTIGLNAKSAVKEEAWDFIKFMMSEELAYSPLSAGFPINKAVYAKGIEELKQAGEVKGHAEGPLHGASVQVDDAQLAKLTDYVNGAIHPVAYQSGKIEELVNEESQAFFGGQKTAEAVAKLIQNKATTYLNE